MRDRGRLPNGSRARRSATTSSARLRQDAEVRVLERTLLSGQRYDVDPRVEQRTQRGGIHGDRIVDREPQGGQSISGARALRSDARASQRVARGRRISRERHGVRRPPGGADVGRRAGPQDLPLVENDEAVRDALRFVEIVRRKQDRAVPRAERDDERAQHLGHLWVERGPGLVEQQDRWIVYEGPCDRDLLAHTARERRELAIEDVVEPEKLRQLRGPNVRVGDVVEPREEAEIGPQRHSLVERWLIGDEATPRAHRVRVLLDRNAVDQDLALARREDPADDPARG